MAGSLGVGLAQVASRYGVQVVNEGTPGCSLASADSVQVLTFTAPPGAPCRAGDPAHLLDVYRSLIAQYDPDVVVYLARSDTLTTSLDGTWQYAGMPSFDRWIASRFDQAIPVLSAQGAHVVFLTSPLYDSGEETDGSAWPEDNPTRVAADNQPHHPGGQRFRRCGLGDRPGPDALPRAVTSPVTSTTCRCAVPTVCT